MNIKNYTFNKYLNGEAGLLDAHMHVGLIKQAKDFAANIKDYKSISYGVLPSLYLLEKNLVNENLEVGIGYHPWYIKDDKIDEELALLLDMIEKVNFIGEIGLDFSEKHRAFRKKQIEVFTKVCEKLALCENKTVSIHAVNSCNNVLNILNKTGADKNNTIIFHWFSGSTENMQEALKKGYYFSIGPKMLDTRRGFDYARQLPEEKILTETDIPWDQEPLTNENHLKLLNDLQMRLRDIKSY